MDLDGDGDAHGLKSGFRGRSWGYVWDRGRGLLRGRGWAGG